MAYEYFADEELFAEQLKIEEDPEQFAKWCDKYIYNVSSHTEYLELCGGIKRLNELRSLENPVVIS